MKNTLKLLNDEIDVDVQKFIDGKLLLQANTGGGKSHATRRIIEHFAGVVPQIIIDPEGEFFTLRQKFPDFILIGKGQSVTADPKSAALLAHKLIEERVSCIIDLLEMKPLQRNEFVKNFIQAMIDAPRELWLPTLVTVDEAQIFAPERGESEVTAVLNDAGFRFRKRHFGLILATPRISELSKSVASTCRNKLIGLANLDIDMKRAAAEIGFTSKDDINSLRRLDPGEFYAYGPAFSKDVIKLKIGKVKTQHGDSANATVRVAKPSAKVQKALEILASVPQEAEQKAKSITDLKTELSLANRKILELGRAQPIFDAQGLTNTVLTALKKRDQEWEVIIKGYEKFAFGFIERELKATEIMGAHKTHIWPAKEPKPFTKPLIAGGQPLPLRSSTRTIGATKQTPTATTPAVVPDLLPRDEGTRKANTLSFPHDGSTEMGAGERKILIAVGHHQNGITRAHVTIETDYRQSARDTYLSRLKSRGFIEIRQNKFCITADGVTALGDDYSPVPMTGEELKEFTLSVLTGGEKKIFEFLLQNPQGVTRDEITAACDYKQSARDTFISHLKTREVATSENGLIKALELFFV